MFVPPPLPTALAEQPQTRPVPEESPDEEESSSKEQPLCVAYQVSEVDDVQENDERMDNEIERIYKHPLKILKLKILYQEWHVGLITWYKTLDKYRIAFDDVTEE